jgi:beta-glucosidase
VSHRPLAIAIVALLATLGCGPKLAFDAKVIAEHKPFAGAPRGFLFGAATSAHQIEGGTRNDWTEWEKGHYPDGTRHVADGASAARAADSWNYWRSDVAALQLLGANAYRLGVEWSRLEPMPGAWDDEAAGRYREMFAGLRAAGITPIVNLYHFTLPPWVAARGGWDWDGAAVALAAFAGRAGAAFGDLVDWWCTINEPNVLVAKGYLAGQWPPGVRDPRRGALALAALMRAHALMTAELRARDRVDVDGDGRATVVGFAHNVRVFDPRSSHPVDGIAAAIADGFYNEAFLDAITLGRIRVVLPKVIDIDEPFPALAGSLDYLGLNYYTRDLVIGHLRGPTPYQAAAAPGRPRNDLGWEIYPEGLTRLLVRYASRGWPLFVTEAGVSDSRGVWRDDFLRAHIYATDRARAQGAHVIGYLVWSLIDNFEWSHGYRGHFGLYAIDFNDPLRVRRPTSAVAVFRQAANHLAAATPTPAVAR